MGSLGGTTGGKLASGMSGGMGGNPLDMGSQTLGGGIGHFFHLREIDIQPRTFFAEGLLDDNFSPLLGKPRDGPHFFGRQLPCCHGDSTLEVREIRQGEFPAAIVT